MVEIMVGLPDFLLRREKLHITASFGRAARFANKDRVCEADCWVLDIQRVLSVLARSLLVLYSF